MLKSKLEFFGKGGDVSTGKAFTKTSYRGLVQVGSRDSLRRMALAIKRIDKRRKTQRLDLTGLCGKLIKFVTPNLL